MINVNAAGSSTINWPSMPEHGNVTLAANATSGGGSDGSSASYDSADNWYKFSKSTFPMYVMDFTLKNTGNNVFSDMNPSYTYHVKQEFVVYCNTPGVNFYQLISSFSKPVFSCTVLGGGKSSSVEVTSFTGTYAVYVTFEFDVTEFTKVETLRFRIDGGGQSVPAYEFWLRVSDTEVTVKSPNDDVIANDNKNHEEVKGFWNNLFSKLGEWFNGLIDGIVNGLKSLFIPKDGFMEQFFSDIDDFLQQHLGALYYPFSVMIDILQKILAFQPPDNPSITLPKLSFPLDGTTYTLWEDTVYNFDILNDEPFKTIYDFYLMAVDCMFAFALVKLFKKKLDEVMTG